MSTVATISPYESNNEGDSLVSDSSVEITGTTVKAEKSFFRLLKYDEKQKEFIDRYREEKWKQGYEYGPLKVLSSTLKPASVELTPVCATLKLRTAEAFVMSAESLGFKLAPLVDTARSLDTQSQLILTNVNGERLVVNKNKAGRLVVKSERGATVIKKVVEKHSLDMVKKYLIRSYGAFKVEKSTNGEIAFVSVEPTKKHDGQAKIIANINKDGEVVVDVSNIKGKRCNVIIQDVAKAVGGECVEASRKKEYFQGVEERGKVRV